MLWPDMIWVYVLAYDIWNFQYTYLNLPTHSWYCGLALLLAPTFAAALWNKGGWIQNRAKAQKKNPWKEEIFTDTRDYQEAMARAK